MKCRAVLLAHLCHMVSSVFRGHPDNDRSLWSPNWSPPRRIGGNYEFHQQAVTRRLQTPQASIASDAVDDVTSQRDLQSSVFHL